MKANIKKRLGALVLVLVMLVSLATTFSFFSDREYRASAGAAGNMNLVFTDISASKTGTNGIKSPNASATDKTWDKEAFVSAGGVLNPGDFFDLSYKVSNKGSMSMDVRQQLVLTSHVALTKGAEEYKLTIKVGNSQQTVSGNLSTDKKSITYNLADITLNGSIEKETGVNIAEQTYSVRLDFALMSENTFQGQGMSVHYKAQAKQHRNTTNADWANWAEYKTKFEVVAP